MPNPAWYHERGYRMTGRLVGLATGGKSNLWLACLESWNVSPLKRATVRANGYRKPLRTRQASRIENFADHGIRLMHLDSQITDQVLTVATRFELPVLGVHDSFIVARDNQDTLIEIVNTATREIIGVELPMEVSTPVLSPNRTVGYLERQRHHRLRYT